MASPRRPDRARHTRADGAPPGSAVAVSDQRSEGARQQGARSRIPWSGSVVPRAIALVGLLIGAFVFGYLRHVPAPSAFAAGPEYPSPDDPRIALFRAADDLEARLAPGGTGFSFTATQIQLLRAYPDGPELLLQPDRDHPDREPAPVDQIILGGLSGRGTATAGAFFAEWFNGTTPEGLPAFEGEPSYRALVEDGDLWRRDERSDELGLGWLASPDVPGFGVDPVSVREWPELLRRLDGATLLGVDADGHHWRGTSSSLWYPGAVAVDGAQFTGPTIQVELWLDDADRVVGLFAVAQNINEPSYQLLCVNRVRLDLAATVPVPAAPDEASQP